MPVSGEYLAILLNSRTRFLAALNLFDNPFDGLRLQRHPEGLESLAEVLHMNGHIPSWVPGVASGRQSRWQGPTPTGRARSIFERPKKFG